MFLHNFKYACKTLIQNKVLLFWTFLFPILLATFFHMAFSNIEKSEKAKIINIAIVKEKNLDADIVFQNAFAHLSNPKNKDRLFQIAYTDLQTAQKKLDKKEITGYLTKKEDHIKITVKESGIEETILKDVVKQISSQNTIINTIIEKEIKKGNQNYQDVINKVQTELTETKVPLQNIANQNLSYTMIEYYTLLAMTCLYGAILSMYITNQKLPNISAVGKKVAISPTHKRKMLIAGLLASYIIQIIGILLLLAYTIFALKVDYGPHLPHVLFLCLTGSLAGLSLGIAVATLSNANENTKTGILITITMIGCFLSGMMGITMKYIIDKNIPVINRINPANMITDGLYSLYYYGVQKRYILNITSLLCFSICMLLLSYQKIRRQKYDSM